MNSEQFQEWCKRHNLNAEQAAKVLGTSRANSFKFFNGSRPVSLPIIYSIEAIELLPPNKCLHLIKKRLASKQ